MKMRTALDIAVTLNMNGTKASVYEFDVAGDFSCFFFFCYFKLRMCFLVVSFHFSVFVLYIINKDFFNHCMNKILYHPPIKELI